MPVRQMADRPLGRGLVYCENILNMINKAVIQNINQGFIGVFKAGGLINKTYVNIDNLPDSLESFGRAVIVASSEMSLCFRLKETEQSQVDQAVLKLTQELKLDINRLTVYINRLTVYISETLVVMIRRDKLDGLLSDLSSYNCKVIGILPEQVAIHKIAESEIVASETQLILHVGEKTTQMYLLDKHGPVKTHPVAIINEDLIPAVHKFIKGQEYCRKGVYFGKRSLSFDKKLFEDQTAVKLVDGAKLLSQLALDNKQNISKINNLDESVCVLATALVFKEKDLLRIDHRQEKRARLRLSQLKFPWKGALLGLVVAGITAFLAIRGFSYVKDEPVDSVSKSDSIELQALSPTPTVELVNAGDIKVRVLNGSGIVGEAGRYSTIFKEAGFEVIESGNAPAFDYDTTEIRYKNGQDAQLSLILEELEGAVLSKDLLDKNDNADIEVIIGKD